MADAATIAAVEVDAESFPAASRDEWTVAAKDLVENGRLKAPGAGEGPWRLNLSLRESRLAVEVEGLGARRGHLISLTPLKGLMRDYLMICDSHVQAVHGASPSQIEALDMGRRGLHDEAGRTLCERLSGKLDMDLETGRRFFTLLCALNAKA
ncbi:UPF0262 family protein [Peiella sedimenti]